MLDKGSTIDREDWLHEPRGTALIERERAQHGEQSLLHPIHVQWAGQTGDHAKEREEACPARNLPRGVVSDEQQDANRAAASHKHERGFQYGWPRIGNEAGHRAQAGTSRHEQGATDHTNDEGGPPIGMEV